MKKEALQAELSLIQIAKSKFNKAEDLYEAHRQITMPLVMLKVEEEMNVNRLMPKCTVEEMGGYAPLTQDEMNGITPLTNQPLWRMTWIQKYNRAIIEYADAPRRCRINPTYCPVKRKTSMAKVL